MSEAQMQLLASLGVSDEKKRSMELEGWDCYSLNHDSGSSAVPILLVESGPKNITDIKRVTKRHDTCVIISTSLKKLFIKTLEKSETLQLESDREHIRIAGILRAQGVADAKSELGLNACLENAIDAIPTTAGEFENRGLFSTHYLRNRIFDDAPEIDVSVLRNAGTDAEKLLKTLGWKIDTVSKVARIIITRQENFSIRETEDDVAPSYTAVSELSKYKWVILTNGTKWRLYTNRVSASSTNYFEINLDEPSDAALKYLGAIFAYSSFEGKNPHIDLFFDQGKEFATQLEEDLASRIMSQDGVLLNLTKGILNHNMKAVFDSAELISAKETALRLIYRIWFVAYAESRNLLPISDSKYKSVSLRRLRGELDRHESESKGDTCWKYLLKLFKGIRNGSSKHNLPQYNGDLFRHDVKIDGVKLHNRWIVPAIRDLLERNGNAIDYASLGVRHLGNILEGIMEFTVQQASEDIMLLEKNGKLTQIKSKKDSTYSYKKNDLYLASKGGIVVRKSTASFYTPDEIVSFLVRRGLEPILDERSKQIPKDLRAYQKTPKNKTTQRTCMDRLLDIQVLDPTMGSGHFLVEALNQLTAWATGILRKHPQHPLLNQLKNDRNTILAEQKKNGIDIDGNLLTDEVLLKRRIMKRCIFGVDLNPMAVEITKLALWLDSFAIGVPLTYMNHHIKTGDSTIGSFFSELEDKKNSSLDSWMPGEESNKMIADVVNSPDVTINQVHASEDRNRQHEESVNPSRQLLDVFTASRIDDSFLPKRSRIEFIHKFKNNPQSDTKEFANVRRIVNELSQRRRFFHWELEMMDAFTDARHGFDCIVGNPPWDKPKANDDEFFSVYDPTFKSLSTKTKKEKIKKKLLEDATISKSYGQYRNDFEEKSMFYKTYGLQGTGDKDLSKLVLEIALGLVAKGGTISMVLPSQILSSTSSGDLRKEILKNNIRQLYVFENRKKIFPIDSRYRFQLLTLRNEKGKNEFSVGFYLHQLVSLNDPDREKKKFGTMSKKDIAKLSSSHIIPEVLGDSMEILVKLADNNPFGEGLEDGTQISLFRGFDSANDADLLRDDGKGWPVHEGKTIHQYNHQWAPPEFTVKHRDGLECEGKKKVFQGKHVKFYDSYRLLFRSISSPTNMRTAIATIIPPHTFLTDSLRSIVLTKNNLIRLDASYIHNILYLCGLMNTLAFDFLVRTTIQMNLPAIIKSLPIPSKSSHSDKITTLVAKMVVGTPEFAGLAEQMRIENTPLTVKERIETAAKIDAMVALDYDLRIDEYRAIIDSFPAFRRNPNLHDMQEIVWDNNNLKEFYGEMAGRAIRYFKEFAKNARYTGSTGPSP